MTVRLVNEARGKESILGIAAAELLLKREGWRLADPGWKWDGNRLTQLNGRVEHKPSSIPSFDMAAKIAELKRQLAELENGTDLPPHVSVSTEITAPVITDTANPLPENPTVTDKRTGRPKGVKNKPK